MTCPNCGAELEQHAFVHVCPYCGTITQMNDSDADPVTNAIHNINNNPEYYNYIKENISYIQSQSYFVSVTQDDDSYRIQTVKDFHPLERDYRLCDRIRLKWRALIDKSGIQLYLIVSGIDAKENKLCIILNDDIQLILSPSRPNEYLILYEDLITLCNSDKVELFANANKLHFDELITYSHRFYNLVFDRTKYKYAINQKLLTD